MINDTSIALHIGAHRTATTHIQTSLRLNARALRGAGVAVRGPRTLRRPGWSIEELFGLFGNPAPAVGVRARIHDLARGRARLILSEENYIGHFRRPNGDMKVPIYPEAGARLAALTERLDGTALDVYLAVRNPVDWLVSCYSQVLMGDVFVQPDAFFLRNRVDDIDWVDLVARVRAVPGLRHLVVWDFESYPGNAVRLIQHAVGRAVPDLHLHPEVSHPGLSLRALEEALRRGEPGAARLARRTFPISATNPKFAPVDPDLATQAVRAYRRQLTQIRAMDGVTFLGEGA